MPDLAGFLSSTGRQASPDQTPLLHKQAELTRRANPGTLLTQTSAGSGDEHDAAGQQPSSPDIQHRPPSLILSELSAAQGSFGVRAKAAAKSALVHFFIGTLFGVLFMDIGESITEICGVLVQSGSSSSSGNNVSDDSYGPDDTRDTNICFNWAMVLPIVMLAPMWRVLCWVGAHKSSRTRVLCRRCGWAGALCYWLPIGIGLKLFGTGPAGQVLIIALIFVYCQGGMIAEILEHPNRSQLLNIAARLAGAAAASGVGWPAFILQVAISMIVFFLVLVRLWSNQLVFHPSRMGGTNSPHMHTAFGDGRLSSCQRKLHMAGALCAWFGAASQVSVSSISATSRSLTWAAGLALAAGLAGLSATLMNRARSRAKLLILLLVAGLLALLVVLLLRIVQLPRQEAHYNVFVIGVVAAGAYIGSLLEWRLIQSPAADVSDWFWCVALCPMYYVAGLAGIPYNFSWLEYLLGTDLPPLLIPELFLALIAIPALLLLLRPGRDSCTELAARSAHCVDPQLHMLVELAQSKGRMTAPLSTVL